MRFMKTFEAHSTNNVQDGINQYKSRIDNLKEEFLQEIISDDTLTKVEKLKVISQNKLFRTSSSIEEPFHQYYQEYLNMFNRDPCVDDFFTIHEYCRRSDDRHQGIFWDLAQVAESAERGYYSHESGSRISSIAPDLNNDEPQELNDKIVIFTNRTNKTTFSITTRQFIDAIYDWCIESKIIGFEFDW